MFTRSGLLNEIKSLFSKLPPDDENGIKAIGHRVWVGGLWDEIGKLQFDFLIAQGLKPNHVLLDIACGSLRGGRLLIPYLDAGNYLGIEQHKALIDAGLQQEIDPAIVRLKKPEFVISSEFEFDKFSKKPDFCIAQSIFTHLNPKAINQCLGNLAHFATTDCRLFATFFESRRLHLNFFRSSHSHAGFAYTRLQMESFGRQNGWSANYLGDWHHPRGQKMIEYYHL
jgi:hypothetical protein